jgi:hypothetical protein
MLLAALATCTACSEQAAGTPHKGLPIGSTAKIAHGELDAGTHYGQATVPSLIAP